MSVYFGDEWKSHEDLRRDYPQAPDDKDIIFAGYTYEDYSGDAIVVFRKDGKIYQNDDGHCSCNGLEHWEPEETSVEALRMQKRWQPHVNAALDAAGL